ncbi:MAG TPA: hypothetical protein VL202_16110 [Pararhizobium sp.]|uniref:DUF6949 family protein n=1 Tax=Pararhizobium sp. TaxID=1977563 RepID=UPI002BB3B46B|nr:hypothetical protein [Pararhizobium sp.]HTO32684.1 hypothetical protein [Pararhizobium sp.]
MNFVMLLTLLAAGFGVSFIVLDISRVAARDRWPSAQEVWTENFRPFAIFLALFAGPSLFARSVWQIRRENGLAAVDIVLAAMVALGWACCYGAVIVRCAGLLGMQVP